MGKQRRMSKNVSSRKKHGEGLFAMIARLFWFAVGLALLYGAVLLFGKAGLSHWGVWAAGLLGIAAIIFSFLGSDRTMIDAGPSP